MRTPVLQRALSATGQLSEDNIYVTVLDDYGSFSDLAGGGGIGDNGSDVFQVSVDPACPMGHTVTYSLLLTAPSGYSAIVEFSTRLSVIGK